MTVATEVLLGAVLFAVWFVLCLIVVGSRSDSDTDRALRAEILQRLGRRHRERRGSDRRLQQGAVSEERRVADRRSVERRADPAALDPGWGEQMPLPLNWGLESPPARTSGARGLREAH